MRILRSSFIYYYMGNNFRELFTNHSRIQIAENFNLRQLNELESLYRKNNSLFETVNSRIMLRLEMIQFVAYFSTRFLFWPMSVPVHFTTVRFKSRSILL